jgi:hypothetical protein
LWEKYWQNLQDEEKALTFALPEVKHIHYNWTDDGPRDKYFAQQTDKAVFAAHYKHSLASFFNDPIEYMEGAPRKTIEYKFAAANGYSEAQAESILKC